MHMLPKTRALRDRRFRHYCPLMYVSRDTPREPSHALPNLITTMRSGHAVDRDLETAIRVLNGGQAKRTASGGSHQRGLKISRPSR